MLLSIDLTGAYEVLFVMSIMLFLGLMLGKLAAHFKLPEISGFIIAGMLLTGFNIVTDTMVHKLEFVSNISLGFITFSFGTLLFWPNMRKHLVQILVVLLVEIVLIFGLTLGLFLIFKQPLWFAIIMSAISIPTATAPFIEITKKHMSKGPLTNLIAGIAGWDNLVSILIFLMLLPVAFSLKNNTQLVFADFVPGLKQFGIAILLGGVLGAALGFLENKLIRRFVGGDRYETYLVSGLVAIFLGTSISMIIGVPYFLTNLIAGFVFTNMIGRESFDYGTTTLDKFMPPFLIIFFVIAGAELSIMNLITYGGLTVILVLGNVIGKYVGGWLGALAAPKTSKIQDKYLKTSLFPHGGIEIALASVAVLHLEDPRIKAIVLTTVLIFEFFGPMLLQYSLNASGEFMVFSSSEHARPCPIPDLNDHEIAVEEPKTE